ncbi:MAG: GGDEF domain-containing protein [Burkholderiaceae bacterium]
MFDIRSMFLVAALTSFTCMIVLWSMRQSHRPSRNGLVLASLGEGCMAVAMAFIAIRGIVPEYLSIYTANTLSAIAGMVFYAAARCLFGRQPFPHWLIAFTVMSVALHTYWGSDPRYHLERICLTSIIQGGTSAAIIPLMLARRGMDATVPLRWGIAFASVYSSLHLARLIVSLKTGVQVQPGGMVTGNPMIELMAAFFSIAPMIYAMVMIGVVNGRLAYEYRRLASVDSLTGLNVRRSFFDRAKSELQTNKADTTRQSVVMMMDLDHFKRINDALGHPAGDAVLVSFAQVLRQSMPKHAVLCRYGGEEFCALVPNTTPKEALDVANRICARTREIPVGDFTDKMQVSVSVGIAIAPDDGNTATELVLTADRRVYLAKSAGRDQVFAADRRPDLFHAPGSPGYVVNDMLPI